MLSRRAIILALSMAALGLTPGPVLAHCGPHVKLAGETTYAMEMDAIRQLKVANVQLDATYRTLLALLDPAGKKLLIKAERTWIQYRDEECNFNADQYRGGSLSPVSYGTCQIRLTRQHECELQLMVRDYSPH